MLKSRLYSLLLIAGIAGGALAPIAQAGTDPSEAGLTSTDSVGRLEWTDSIHDCPAIKIANGPAKGILAFQPSCLRDVRRYWMDDAWKSYRSAWESVPPEKRGALWKSCSSASSW